MGYLENEVGIEPDLIESGENWIEKFGAQVDERISCYKRRRDGWLSFQAPVFAQRLHRKQSKHSPYPSPSSSFHLQTLTRIDTN